MKTFELSSGFTCPVCSGNQIKLPDDRTDDTPVECANCETTEVPGAMLTLGNHERELLKPPETSAVDSTTPHAARVFPS